MIISITKKQLLLTAAFLSYVLLMTVPVQPAYAATSQVNFDPDSGTLSVAGTCSSSFVLLIIRRASDNSIWGSSDPNCVSGSYTYNIVVPPGDRNGANFVVDAMDANSVDQSMSSMKSQASNSAVNVTFTAPTAVTAITTATITLDTSTLGTAPDSTSFLDEMLQNCFGIVTSALNAAEASVVAAMQMFAKLFTILPGGSITVPTGQNQISGTGLLQADDSEIFIANTSVTSSSQIIITPTSVTQVPLVATQIVDGSGFDVGTISPQQIPVSFTWLVINTYAAGPPASAGTPTMTDQTVTQPTDTDNSSTDLGVASDTTMATDTAIIADVATTTDVTMTDSATTTAPIDDSTDTTDATDTVTQ